MNIKELTAADYEKYNALSTIYGTVFDSRKWTGMFGSAIRHYGIYDAKESLIGGFFSYTGRAWGISIYRNPPLTPSIGPFFKIESGHPVHTMEKHKQIITALADFIGKLGHPVISFSLSRNVMDMQPFIWKRFKVIPEYTYIIDLGLSGEDIWKRMSAKRRNDVSKAKKDGLLVKKVDDYGIVRSLVLKTFERQNIAYSDFYMNKVLFDFADAGNSFAFAAFNGGIPVACTFCICDEKTSYYLLGGYDSENGHRGAGAACVYEAIKYAKELGRVWFDFEGSMVPDIECYFRGFGGRLTAYYRINKAALPLEMALKFFKRELF